MTPLRDNRPDFNVTRRPNRWFGLGSSSMMHGCHRACSVRLVPLGIVRVLLEPTVMAPALVSELPTVKFLPFWIVKLPVAAFVVKLASASVPVSSRSSCEEAPSSTIVAALVTMFALAKRIVPSTLYVPPVKMLVLLL